MQELEKILEEIEEEIRASISFQSRRVYGLQKARDIIRKHMNDDNEITEQCPYCENEAALHWDVEKDGHQVFCPNCGKPMMLCSMCDARDGAVCDWKEGEGCKHSDERYRDYFRKHMNDGWNPVEQKPNKDYIAVLAVDKHDYYFVAVYDKEHGFRSNDIGADIDNIVAYSLFNPYRQERSDDHDRE